jgi:hypothetical protein
MKRSQLEHILRAARKICDDDEFIIIGSQSLHGKYPDMADEILMSQEVDIIAKNNEKNTEWLNVIGVDSPFHETFGYYADPVDLETAILPKNWRNRLVHLKIEGDTEGAKAYCLEPHDLAIAKLAAGRDKDIVFIRALLARKLLDVALIKRRIEETALAAARKTGMQQLFDRLSKG